MGVLGFELFCSKLFSLSVQFPVDKTWVLFKADFDGPFCKADLNQHFLIKSFLTSRFCKNKQTCSQRVLVNQVK